MQIDRRNEAGLEILALSGRITMLEGTEPLRERFATSLAEGRRHFLFDLRELQFLDSASIGDLIACLRQASEQAGSVRLLVVPDGTVDRVLRLSAMDRLFEILDEQP